MAAKKKPATKPRVLDALRARFEIELAASFMRITQGDATLPEESRRLVQWMLDNAG